MDLWMRDTMQSQKDNEDLPQEVNGPEDNTGSQLKQLSQVAIKYGILQTDALSLLLFCIDLNPSAWYGWSKTTINFLLYMDDIKLYG